MGFRIPNRTAGGRCVCAWVGYMVGVGVGVGSDVEFAPGLVLLSSVSSNVMSQDG